MSFPNLTTGRLLLRRPGLRDAPEVLRLRSDPRVNEFIDRPGAQTLEEARSFIENIKAGIGGKECFYWAITLKGADTLIGTICLWNFTADGAQAEVGYELSPDHQGRGIMHEALEKVLGYGFGQLRLKVITGLPRADNIRSIRLLERNGFRLDVGFEYVPEAAGSGLVVYFLSSIVDT